MNYTQPKPDTKYTKHKKKYERVRTIYVHKNYVKQYFDMKWEDVPEFLLFDEVPEGWVQIHD